MSSQLHGKRVLVIGATSGIGKGLARRAARDGADVIAVARRGELLEKLVAEIGGGTAVVADLTKAEDCARMATEAAAEGPIDLVVFCAGTAVLRPLVRTSPEEWSRTLATNLVGVNLGIAALAPHLAEGAIVAALSSEAAGRPYYGLGAYAASKSALEDTMRAWRVEQPSTRFSTVVVGITFPTEFLNGFEQAEMDQAFPVWAAQGNASTELMDRNEVADVLADTFGALLPNRTVGMETVVLRSPAPTSPASDAIHQKVDDLKPKTAG